MVFRECTIISYYDATVPAFWLELCAEDTGVSRKSSRINSLIFWYAMLSFFNSASSVSIHNYAMVLIAVRLRMQASDICGLEFKKHPVVDKTAEIHVELLLL